MSASAELDDLLLRVPAAMRVGLGTTVPKKRTGILKVEHGVPVERPPAPVGRGGMDALSATVRARAMGSEEAKRLASAGTAEGEESLPRDIVTAGVQLTFFGYFKEPVVESHDERERVRHLTLLYFLEDDTVALFESPVENSGLPQGIFLKRCRLRKGKVGVGLPGSGVGATQRPDREGAAKAAASAAALSKSRMLRGGGGTTMMGSSTRRGLGTSVPSRTLSLASTSLAATAAAAAPRPADHSFVHWSDIRVGETLDVLGRVIRVYGCDGATRRFYEEAPGAATQRPNEEPIVDDYTRMRASRRARETGSPILPGMPGAGGPGSPPTGPGAVTAAGRKMREADPWFGRKTSPVKRYAEAVLGNPNAKQTRGVDDNLHRFLEHGATRLMFMGLWDNSDQPLGEKQKYRIHVHVATDEVEVFEENQVGSGKPPILKVFKREKLPRKVILTDDRSRSIEDDNGDKDYYTVDDFAVGRNIQFLGRNVLLYNADPSTMRWIKKHRGVDMEPDVIDISEPEEETPIVEPPPYLGFGGEEDSLGSFFSLLPQFPRKDQKKAEDYEGVALQFAAKLVGPKRSVSEADTERKFTIQFFMEDDTVAIQEKPSGGGGRPFGKFLLRQRLRNPDTGDFVRATDFGKGKLITLNSWIFKLGEPTETTKAVIEGGLKKVRRFGMADVRFVLTHLKEAISRTYGTVRAAYRAMDSDFSGFITIDELAQQMRKFGMRTTEGELLVLMRHFDKEGDGRVSFQEFVRAFTDADVGEGVGGAADREQSKARTVTDVAPGAETMPETAGLGDGAGGGEITEEEIAAYEATIKKVSLSETQSARLTRLLESLSGEFAAKKGETALREQFRRVDADKSNTVDRGEFRQALTEGFHLPKDDVDLLETAFFPPGQAVLNYEDFMSVLRRNIKRSMH